MTDRELMQKVLKKLDHIWELGVEVENYKLSDDLLPEMKALRGRLAHPDREWVGFTEEEAWEMLRQMSLGASVEDVRFIEAKLKEKNT